MPFSFSFSFSFEVNTVEKDIKSQVNTTEKDIKSQVIHPSIRWINE